MKLQFVHLCPQRMSLYGEYANLVILQRMAEALGHEVEVVAGENPDLSNAHLIYMGCGTEQAQKFALEGLRPQVEDLKGALNRGAVVLFTGNAMEILGQSITDTQGKVWQGLGLADFTTIETRQRTPHDVIANTPPGHSPVVGFLNKCSLTAGVSTPLFESLEMGFGNDCQRGPEGYIRGNLMATHLTGPVLVKNPALAHEVLRRVLTCAGAQVPQTLPVLPHQQEAYDVTLRELRSKGENAG